jgi:hypothetical protein
MHAIIPVTEREIMLFALQSTKDTSLVCEISALNCPNQVRLNLSVMALTPHFEGCSEWSYESRPTRSRAGEERIE